MTLIVETGEGLADAESYLTTGDANMYFISRGITLWDNLTTLEKEQNLRRAVDFMQQYFGGRWKGQRMSSTQALDWPRAGVVLEDGPGFGYGFDQVRHNVIPIEVKNACAELALRASIAALTEDRSTRVLQETVGPLTVKYDQYASQEKIFVAVNRMVSRYLKGSGMNIKLQRC